MSDIVIKSDEQQRLRDALESRNDVESMRVKRYLNMPDLSRTDGSPIHEIVKRVLADSSFKDFDVIEVPEIVPTDVSFELFDFPSDHPARSTSDTYYIDENHILRTHNTVMWYYYLRDEGVKNRMAAGESVGAFCYGKVYRKDELDRQHLNVFHQMDAWYLTPRDKKEITIDDLKAALTSFAQAIFGSDIPIRFNPDQFPYTHPSLEMEINKNNRWLEVVGAGIVKGSVLEKFGVDSSKWNGWAFGPGLERFAMISMDLPDIRLLWSDDPRVKNQLKLGNKYKEVSPYPPITRDISFIVDNQFVPNDYFDLIRDIGGDIVEQVELLDKFEDENNSGPARTSYPYRVVYRSPERTLTLTEIEPLQKKLYEQTRLQYNAELR